MTHTHTHTPAVLTSSQLRTLKDCPFKNLLSYEHGIKPAEKNEAFAVGSLVHHYLEWRGKGEADPLLKVASLLEAPPNVSEEELLEFAVRYYRTTAMLSAYESRWDETDKQVQVLQTELEFEIPIMNPETSRPSTNFTLAGKIDAIVRMPSGALAVMEHKTTSEDISPDADYWRRLRLDSQISLYVLAAKHLGFNVESVYYNVLRKPGKTEPKELTQAQTRDLIDGGGYFAPVMQGAEPTLIYRPDELFVEGNGPDYLLIDGDRADVIQGKKGFSILETPRMYGFRMLATYNAQPDRYFARREIARGQRDIESIQREVWIQQKILRERQLGNYWEKNESACLRFSRCPYFQLCTEGFNPQTDLAALPDNYYVAKSPHEELKGDEGE